MWPFESTKNRALFSPEASSIFEVPLNPNGSINPVGLCSYLYGLNLPSRPIGSGQRYCPVPLSSSTESGDNTSWAHYLRTGLQNENDTGYNWGHYLLTCLVTAKTGCAPRIQPASAARLTRFDKYLPPHSLMVGGDIVRFVTLITRR